MKYKIGDRVKIKSRNWYNEHKDMNGNVTCGCIQIFNPCTACHCGQILTIKYINCLGEYEVEEEAVFVNDGMIEGLVEDEISFDTEYEWKHEFNCPDGYQFVDENGNVINTKKIVLEKKKKEYPKTYEECCKILDFGVYQYGAPYYRNSNALYYWHLVGLQKLLVCRNAYWKLYREEMGLGKPWEPDWTIYEHKFCIGTNKNKVVKECLTTGNRILAFPTEEMRDAFYDNFKELIEQCKKLL